MAEHKEYGEMIESPFRTWNNEPIYYQRVTVRRADGSVIRTGERKVMANGEAPSDGPKYSNRGIV